MTKTVYPLRKHIGVKTVRPPAQSDTLYRCPLFLVYIYTQPLSDLFTEMYKKYVWSKKDRQGHCRSKTVAMPLSAPSAGNKGCRNNLASCRFQEGFRCCIPCIMYEFSGYSDIVKFLGFNYLLF